YELGRRAAELLAGHGDAWLEGVGVGRDKAWFHRGFLEGVTLKAKDFLRRAERLFLLAPLRRLALRDPAYLVEKLAACPPLAHLEQLNLGVWLHAPEAAALARSPHLTGLRTLELFYCHLGAEAVEALVAGPWPALRRLELPGNPLGNDGAAAL